MFEQLEDLREKPKFGIKFLPISVTWLFVVGIVVGILIGRRRWDWTAWTKVGIYALPAFLMFARLYRDLKRNLKDDAD